MKFLNKILNEKHDYYMKTPGQVVNGAGFVGTMTLREAMNKVWESATEGSQLFTADEYDPLYDSGYTKIWCIDESVCDSAYKHLYDDDNGWYWYPCYKTDCDFFELDPDAGYIIPCSYISKKYYAITNDCIDPGNHIVHGKDGKLLIPATIYLELHNAETDALIGSVSRDLIAPDVSTATGHKCNDKGEPIKMTVRQWTNEFAKAFEELIPDLIDLAEKMGIDEDQIDFEYYRDQYDDIDPNDFYFN